MDGCVDGWIDKRAVMEQLLFPRRCVKDAGDGVARAQLLGLGLSGCMVKNSCSCGADTNQRTRAEETEAPGDRVACQGQTLSVSSRYKGRRAWA